MGERAYTSSSRRRFAVAGRVGDGGCIDDDLVRSLQSTPFAGYRTMSYVEVGYRSVEEEIKEQNL